MYMLGRTWEGTHTSDGVALPTEQTDRFGLKTKPVGKRDQKRRSDERRDDNEPRFAGRKKNSV